jgi:transcriptional regulator with XRE-family HTH domain
MAHIGNNIARIRMFNMIAQKEMAYFLKISQQEYSRIEKKESIDVAVLNNIAERLNCSVDFILCLPPVGVYSAFNELNNNAHINTVQASIDVVGLKAIYEQTINEKELIISIQKDKISIFENTIKDKILNIQSFKK